MIEKEKNLLFIKSVLKACDILTIDKSRLFTSLGLKDALNIKAQGRVKLTKEETETFAKIIQIYLYLDTFCGGNIEFIHHWINTENKYFDQAPRELFYTKQGIQKLYFYVQQYN